MPKARSLLKPVGLPIIHPFAAGIDIGSRFHVAAASPDLCDEPVQTFKAFTRDLRRMADWLVETGNRAVVMESTGVYWVDVYEVLESRGLEQAQLQLNRFIPDKHWEHIFVYASPAQCPRCFLLSCLTLQHYDVHLGSRVRVESPWARRRVFGEISKQLLNPLGYPIQFLC